MFGRQLRLRYGFTLLLCSFVFLLVVPAYWSTDNRHIVRGVLLVLTILSCLVLVLDNHRERITAMLLAIPSLYLTTGIAADRDSQPALWLIGLNVIFYMLILFVLLRFILRAKKVNVNILSAAVCGYFIIGLVWGYVYTIIALLSPRAFSEFPAQVYNEVFATMMYFSFVTLTTLGFGDITPLSAEAQSWAILEAIVGPFYLTILVARLVSIYGMELKKD